MCVAGADPFLWNKERKIVREFQGSTLTFLASERHPDPGTMRQVTAKQRLDRLDVHAGGDERFPRVWKSLVRIFPW